MPVSKNLFTGQNGSSDGTINGPSDGVGRVGIADGSIKIINSGGKLSIYVKGEFDGCEVRLQQWLVDEWVSLEDSLWTYPKVLSGVSIETGTAFRLIISKGGVSTNVKAGVAY